ncbi:MAG TPA: tetratricopeptide repeat protein [Chitinispirillaceae bacterium]|nr:tetratricopeptide repeat protein [Chitinispirillaceae bacterium]
MKIQAVKSLFVVLITIFLVSAQSIEEMMASGQQLLERGAYSEAVSAFRQVTSREPSNFEAQYNLGYAYLGWGRYSNAVEEFKKAMRIQNRNSALWGNLAIAYEQLGRSQDAINALYQAVQIDPQNITARMNLATSYANANHYKEAIAQYKQVISIEGVHEEALVNISKCLIAVGNYQEAKNYLKQASVANPNNGSAHWELGNIYWKKEKDIDKGISEYKLAVSVEPENDELYDNLALALEEKGKKDEALEVWKKCMAYCSDALRKEKIQDRIDRLQYGTKPGSEPNEPAMKMATKNQIDELKKELRNKEGGQGSQRINTAPVNVMDDFSDLNEQSEVKPLNLKDEAKKRAKK